MGDLLELLPTALLPVQVFPAAGKKKAPLWTIHPLLSCQKASPTALPRKSSCVLQGPSSTAAAAGLGNYGAPYKSSAASWAVTPGKHDPFMFPDVFRTQAGASPTGCGEQAGRPGKPTLRSEKKRRTLPCKKNGSAPNRLQIGSKSAQIGSNRFKSAQIGSNRLKSVQIGSKSARNRLQIGSKSAPNRLQIGSESAPNGSPQNFEITV